ncbi:MAG TPA: zinc-dependent metalloprotease [Gemmatimonadales bacterium]|nr:zinc-dependent metalloprotease [Gemmatimonadales bacterium]
MRRTATATALLALAVAAAGCAGAQAQSQAPAPARAQNGAARQGPQGRNGQHPQAKMKPYREVIPESAKIDSGLFQVDQTDGKVFYEIPKDLLDKDMLLLTRIAKTDQGIGYGGEEANEEVVHWERHQNKILLRVVSYANIAADSLPIHMAVADANFPPIIAAFDIEAMSPDSNAAVIDVTSLYTTDVPALGLQARRREQYKVRRLDEKRSYIVSVHSFPKNVEVRHVLTYDASAAPSQEETGSISLEMAQSMILLPATPMMPRLLDPRVGYFNIQVTNYGLDAQKAETQTYITRWRLEPKDTAAFRRGELTEPVKPIVYYLDPATPVEWRPYLKKAIENWNVAFEAAGFKNAIIAKDAPTKAEDPEFSLEDMRYSVVRWFPSDVENAYGPHVSDPRSGEILNADVGFYHNVMNLQRDWYFIQTAAANPEARHVKFPTAIMGKLLEFVLTHEVGHTLGLPHNMKASASYPVDSLRTSFSCRMGTAPSIMDYARFNYVAQPGDKGVCFIPHIGPYDIYSINWGYRPILDAKTPQDERPTLDKWIRAHENDPIYRFGDPSSVDPTSQTEALGDDGVKASEYGIANLKRIVPNLLTWTHEPLANYTDDLQDIWQEAIRQFTRYMGHVTTIVGGVYETRKNEDQPGPIFVPVSKNDQQRAMRFLAEQAFTAPTWLYDDSIMSRLDNPSKVEDLRTLQVGVLDRLLDMGRLQRLIENDAVTGGKTYTLGNFFSDLHSAVWPNLASGKAIGVYRRDLQRGYLDRMQQLMTQEQPEIPARFRRFVHRTEVNVEQSDIRPYVRGDLEQLKREITQALRRVHDTPTKLHLQDAAVRIDKILHPKS